MHGLHAVMQIMRTKVPTQTGHGGVHGVGMRACGNVHGHPKLLWAQDVARPCAQSPQQQKLLRGQTEAMIPNAERPGLSVKLQKGFQLDAVSSQRRETFTQASELGAYELRRAVDRQQGIGARLQRSHGAGRGAVWQKGDDSGRLASERMTQAHQPVGQFMHVLAADSQDGPGIAYFQPSQCFIGIDRLAIPVLTE